MKLWWKCPNCQRKVDFSQQLLYVFDGEDGEAVFDPNSGIYFHTISCECGCDWIMTLSEMIYEENSVEISTLEDGF